MKNLYTLIAVLAIAGLTSTAQAVNPALSITQQAVNEEIISLPWKYELKQYSLEKSNSTFKLAQGYSLLMDGAARHYDHIIQGTEKDPNTEAWFSITTTGYS